MISIRKVFVICIVTVILSGCGQANQNRITNRAAASIKDGTVNTYKREGAYQQNPTPIPTGSPQATDAVDTPHEVDEKNAGTAERAKKITSEVIKINGISKTSAVISNNIVLIGIDIEGELEDSKLIKLKSEVERVVKATDTKIEHVAVTAASDLVKRITNMADGVSEEKELPEYNKEIEDIVKKLTPIV